MDIKKFTEQSDWENYWRNQEIVPYERLFIEHYLQFLPKQGKLIEIGGFPGKFAGYFKTKFDYEVTILDYVLFPETVRNVEKAYGLPEGSIQEVKADFFNYQSPEKFDVVTSVGFIEHFDDTALVLKKHVDLMKPGAALLVTLPNFAGVNGWVQKFFDPRNYAIHNIKSMDIRLLKDIMGRLGMSRFTVEYHGKPTIWLEADAPVRPVVRNLLMFMAKVIKRIPFRKNRLLAPHIVIFGIK